MNSYGSGEFSIWVDKLELIAKLQKSKFRFDCFCINYCFRLKLICQDFLLFVFTGCVVLVNNKCCCFMK